MEVREIMLVLITYDVNTEDAKGKGRLRKVAKKCVSYGQRVQNSVFECIVDSGQCKLLKDQLLKIVDLEKDSLRFYYLGNQYKNKIEHYGSKNTVDQEGVLIL
jgi:CRISPR-associated protein Cas2